MKSIQPPIEKALHVSGNCPPSPLYPSSGSVAIPMTNDYLFKAFLQRNNKALKGLSGALLHLKPEEIISVEITNPIVLGKSTNDKTFILDIRVCLNNYAIINLEMQVVNQHNWKEATYQLLNVKNYTLYSDKLRLSVLGLTRIDLATEKDKDHQLDYWASLFKSTTREEITMLAEKNEYIAEAATTIYQLSQDEQIRMECEAREDFYRTQLSIQRKLAKLGLLESTTEELESTKEYLESVNKLLESQNESLASQRHALELQNQALVSQKLNLESQMERICAWAKKHGYDPDSTL